MGFHEYGERKGITSVSISPNGNVVLKNNFSKSKVFISVLTVIALFFAVIIVYYFYTEKKYEVCTTKACLESSLSLMNCMNETVDPCEDFYEFSCGAFETNYPSLHEENSWIKILSLRVKQKVNKFLTQKNEIHEPEAVHKARKFYDVCLSFMKDTADNNYDSLRNVWDKVGLDSDYLNDSAPLEIETVLARIKVYFDIDVYFSIDVDDDPRNSSSNSLLIMYQSGDSDKFKQRNKVTVEEAVPTFTEYFESMMDRLLDRNQNRSRQFYVEDLMNTTEELIDFSANITKISENSFHFNKDVPEIFTLGKLQNLTDSIAGSFQFNWTLYMMELFRDIEPAVYERLTSENADDFEILLNNPTYLENMFKLLSETPPTLIKMHLLTQIVSKLEYYFPSAEYLNSEHCIIITTESLRMITGYSMINTFNDSSKAELAEMFENIKSALRVMISVSRWMDEETKKANLRKLDHTRSYFGYPKNYTNLLDNLYRDLNITDNHLENMISISIFNSKKNWKHLTKANDQENVEWDVTPDEVNAYNYYSMNAFFMPAAILQSPLYHNGIQLLNYGATGSTMGHELSHNYDNAGRLYNELGNVVPTWWTDASRREYEKRADCLVHYYGDIRVTDDRRNGTLEVDGDLTLNENIADIAGLKEAYYAYRLYVNVHGQEPRLPGMEKYGPEQLFFLAYANQYCHYDTAHSIFDSHSPSRVRVQGVLSLMPEFANAWSCETGTPMNPEKDEKCQIW